MSDLLKKYILLYAIIVMVINLSRESKFRLVQEIQDYINKNID